MSKKQPKKKKPQSCSKRAHDSYIVTQMPLPHTITDFWQMILEQRCQTIVMLNPLDLDDQTCVAYWPEEVGMTQIYGQVQVELVTYNDNEAAGAVITRDIRVTELIDKRQKYIEPDTFMIRHFQLLSWPQSDDLPKDKGHILDLFDLIQSWQKQNNVSADKWKTVVHCIDGGSHSGMFCGASFVLDKMRSEQSVDAFLAARYVSRRRPEFFSNLVEYKFLYEMAIESMSKDNVYANFQ